MYRVLLDDDGAQTSYTYDYMNRLLSAGSTTYTWDSNGNMVGKYDGSDTWNYTYDPMNRLTSVLNNSTVQGRYWYDADGRRVRLWDVDTGYLTHVYSGLDVVYEANATASTKHFYANGLHVAENRSGTIEYFHQDHLGSTRLKTNSTGGVVYESNYVPFGPDQNEQGSEEFKYTGKLVDATRSIRYILQ